MLDELKSPVALRRDQVDLFLNPIVNFQNFSLSLGGTTDYLTWQIIAKHRPVFLHFVIHDPTLIRANEIGSKHFQLVLVTELPIDVQFCENVSGFPAKQFVSGNVLNIFGGLWRCVVVFFPITARSCIPVPFQRSSSSSWSAVGHVAFHCKRHEMESRIQQM